MTNLDWTSPVFTRDCCWCLGFDLLKEPKVEIGRIELPYNELGEVKTLKAIVYEFVFNGELVHAAIADYRGGEVCWIADE